MSFFGGTFLETGFLVATFLGAALLAATFLGAAFLSAAFFGAALLAAAFFGAAFFAAGFFATVRRVTERGLFALRAVFFVLLAGFMAVFFAALRAALAAREPLFVFVTMVLASAQVRPPGRDSMCEAF